AARTVDDASQELTFALRGTGVAVTAAYADQPELLDDILATARYDGPVRPTPFATRYPAQPAQAGFAPLTSPESPGAGGPDVVVPESAAERVLPKEGAPGTEDPDVATTLTTPPRIATG